jgi:hypothetical protein
VNPGTVAVIMVFAIPLTAIIGGLIIRAMEVLKVGAGRANGHADREQTRMVQQMHEMLLKMEERIEALETILIEHDRARKDVRE